MTWYEKNPELFQNDKKYIRDCQPGLHFKEKDNNLLLVGEFHSNSVYDGVHLERIFKIKIKYRENHPKDVPKVWELGGIIDQDFHRFKDKSLCLGTPNEVYQKFKKDPSIKNYCENLLNNYFYFFLYKMKFKKEPWHEVSHGADGIFENYKKVLNIKDEKQIIKLLIYYINKYKYAHSLCPCTSNKVFYKCHCKLMKKNIKTPKEILEVEISFLLRKQKYSY